MILPKACPRCIGGDIIVRAEDTNMVATCFQCGYSREFKPGYGLSPSAAFIRETLMREREASRRVEVLR
jgi:Zn ribbon nucleic-acid-binding protein